MSHEISIPRQDDRSDGTSVVEWGGTEREPRGWPGRLGFGFVRDRRLPAVLVALGAVAGAASLVGEWLVLTLPSSGPNGDLIRVPEGVSELGGFGTAYLVGLLILGCTVMLALRGTPPVRPNARVVGLALAVALLVLLAAAAAHLGDTDRRALYYGEQEGFAIEYGRGLVTAFVACALLAAALWPRPSDEPVGEPRGAGRRRRSSDDAEEADLATPADLTVTPAVPFARPEPPV
ncbi:hypothetical protein [Micromonospora endolithica]|uniref:Uncharacterized protein n=1 Tax=Micromonospora endolithica TaxID=230091 RepID=A0A3A9ZDK6_9ACTN|nr:hypothetical protein [Micromonospora endolithica]RKN46269.1 hypothetical protein D7223_15215 [Micromonospora endolithica]TWJ25003.1 hypothetical protein JD76_05163 [Micromonospora endolithica]